MASAINIIPPNKVRRPWPLPILGGLGGKEGTVVYCSVIFCEVVTRDEEQ
jgi:hypothetical protein